MTGFYMLSEWLFSIMEVMLYFMLIDSMTESHFQGTRKRIVFVLTSGIIGIGVILLNIFNLTISLPTLCYATVAFSLGACILYVGKFVEFFFLSIGYLAVLTCIDLLYVSIVHKIINLSLPAEFCLQRLVMIVGVKFIQFVIFFGMYILIKKYKPRLRISGRIFLAIFCILIGSVGCGYWAIQAENVTGIKFSILQTITAICCSLLCCSCYLFFRIREILREKEAVEQQNYILEKNYQTAEKSYESNAKLYHDMRNHFILLQRYLADGKVLQAQEYLSKINGDNALSPVEKVTGIDAVDYILSQKKLEAKKEKIQMLIHAEYPRDCKINPVDLCTILTNLLDNAIEACRKQPAGKERKISVLIRRIHQFIIIRIVNSSMECPRVRNGNLVTMKENRLQHGWGMKSVKAAVDKYEGVIEYNYEQNEFAVSVMLFYE